MPDKQLIHARTAVYNVNYHFVWCVKYRRQVLVGKIDERLKTLLPEIAEEKGFMIKSLEVRSTAENNSTRLRRILVRLRDAAADAYPAICAGGCNKVDGPKDKQAVELFSTADLMPDHVHIFASAHPKYAPGYLYKMLKGISGRRLFLEFPELKSKLWKGHLWNPATYTETVGHVSEATILRYIEDQKSK